MAFIGKLADFLFPRVCHVCGENLDSGAEFLCPVCLASLPRTLYHRSPDNPMERRFMGQFPYRAATGHFFYSRGSALASLIHDFKYRKFKGLANFFGRIVGAELLTTGFLSEIDFILPLPMHFYKQAVRGYNQTVEIAKGLSQVSGIPVSNLLRASRSHRTQTSLTLEQRLKNTENVFIVKNPRELSGKCVLILDDVCTTGATLASAARTVARSCSNVQIVLLTVGVTF